MINLFERYKRGDLSATEIEKLVLDIALDGLNFASETRAKRKYNIPKETDLITEQYDENGLRRYSCRNLDDEAVMVPDKEGFWMPVNDLHHKKGEV